MQTQGVLTSCGTRERISHATIKETAVVSNDCVEVCVLVMIMRKQRPNIDLIIIYTVPHFRENTFLLPPPSPLQSISVKSVNM